jgi:hypothetical protein
MEGLPMQQKLHLLGLIGGIADVVQEVAVAVDVDIRYHASQPQEEVVVFIAQLLLWMEGGVPFMNFYD